MPAQAAARAVAGAVIFDEARLKIKHIFRRPFEPDDRLVGNKRLFVGQGRRRRRRTDVRVGFRVCRALRILFVIYLLVVGLRRKQKLVAQRDRGLRRLIADRVVDADLNVLLIGAETDRDFRRIRRTRR